MKKFFVVILCMFVLLNLIYVKEARAATGDILPDNGAIISSSEIVQTKTGTAPFDDDNSPGNDLNDSNDIVRSFDQIIWTVENTFKINNNTDENYKGGILYAEATIPESCKDVVHWDLDSMGWADGTATISDDGLTFFASYQMTQEDITIPGKQNLSFVLKVDGACNGTEIQPEFKLWLNGNQEKKSVTSKKITVSSRPAYNLSLVRNATISTETTITDDNGDSVKGRVYTYGALLQLYNTDPDKGIKGLEYSKDEINYELELSLYRTNIANGEIEDVTDTFTPILYNYCLDGNPAHLYDPSRNKIALFRGAYYPYGVRNKYDNATQFELETAIYKSGKYTCIQEGNKISVNVKGYDFDGYFPIRDNGSTEGTIKYTNNIGNYSGLYFQVFVPYDEKTGNSYNYYLDVEDSNLNITSISDQQITTQQVTTDDKVSTQHILYRPGNYWHDHYIYDSKKRMIHSAWNTGDGIAYQNQEVYLTVVAYSGNNNTESDNIYSMNILVKFDTNAFEAISDIEGKKMHNSGQFKVNLYYACKKDGKGWNSIQEQQTAKIEDLDYYKTLEEIEAQGKVCVGGLFETTDGVLASNGTQVGAYLGMPVKVKDTATIGQTFQFTSDTRMYVDKLDRQKESMMIENRGYITTPTVSWNSTYVKSEYDESGQILKNTHYPGVPAGNTLLIVCADAKIDVSVTQIQDGNEKLNYDFGKNEYEIEYKLTPSINSSMNDSLNNMSGVTVTVTNTLPKGITYVSNSSSMGEPEITINADGTTTLVWKIYDCTVNEPIEAITFRAHINEETPDGTSYTNTAVISAPQVDKRSEDERKSSYTIEVINLASHRLYKVTSNQVVEKGDLIHYQVIYKNNTDGIITGFQLLDILPYNGDQRGTNFDGTYKLKSLNIVRYASDNSLIEDDEILAYYTNDEYVKGIISKDDSIGDTRWKNISSGSVNDYATAIALKGRVKSQEKIIVDIYLEPENNNPKNVYVNNTSAQTNLITDEIVSSNVKVSVVSRKIDGTVWYDINFNGIKDEDEKLASNINVSITNDSGEQVQDVYGNIVSDVKTDSNGYYFFDNLPKGIYYIKVQMPDDTYTLTEKQVGVNDEINSKFNVGSNETDQITKLNSTDLPELIESFVNAGLVKIQGSIEITKVDKNDNTKVIEGARFKLEKLDQNGNVDSTYTPQELTTGEDGKIKFDGLEVGKYRVTETKAPEGYELLKSSKDVEITGDNKDIKLIAENELKLHLPKTGSINCTAVFTTIGLTLVCIAIVLVIKNKKKIILRKK